MTILSRNLSPFQIAKQVPIVEVATRFLPELKLKLSGRTYLGRCPWHDDRNPSFTVWPDSNRWKCWSCNIGGDSIALVSRALGVRPYEAARRICLDFGLPMDRPATPETKQKARELARERQVEQAFKADLERIHRRLAMIHRNIFQSLRTFEDYERLSGLVHIQPILEYVLDELTSRDPARQVEAWRYVRRWWPWAV